MMMKFILQLEELAPLRIPFAAAAADTFHVEYVAPFGYLPRSAAAAASSSEAGAIAK